MDPVVILGAGLAGLSAAHFAPKPFVLVEQAERVGGLARSECVHGGFYFDCTGHWLHLRDPEIRALVEAQWLPGQLVSIQRKAAILSRGVFTPFPYQMNTFGLPPEVVAENLIGFIEANFGEKGRALRERGPRNFAEFVLRHLGEGFAKNFMLPYNRKLWTVDPFTLSAEWCGRFVPRPALEDVVKGALGLGGEGHGYNATFLYPKEGGIEALPRAMERSLRGGEVLLSTVPTAIDWKAKRVSLSHGRTLQYSRLISTVALPQLVRLLQRGAAGAPVEVIEAAGRLRANTVTYVNVGVKGTTSGWHWVYLPEPEFRSYRIGSPSSVYAALAPEGTSSFYVEFAHQGEMSTAQAQQLAVQDLLRSGLVRNEDAILFAEGREIPHAYVLYDEGYGPAKDAILRFLELAGIHTAGRYGQWEYSSMEDAILSGRAVARAALD